MNDNKKLFSIGLSLGISLEEYYKLYDKYNNYIKSIYFSPPFEEKFHTRQIIVDQFSDPKNVEKFYKIIEFFKKEGVILDCVLNRPSINKEIVEKYINNIKDLNVDQFTCIDSLIDYLSDEFPNADKISSFNNNFKIQNLDNISHKYNTIVIGKNLLRDKDNIEKIYNKGFNVKLLVNNGCSFNCYGCMSGNINCEKTFINNLKHNNVQLLYAMQSFYPDELDKLLSILNFPIESIKISNRTDNYDYLDKCLDSYINNNDTKKYIDEDINNYRLWSRLAYFNPYFKEFNQDEIVKVKKKIWKNTLN